MNGVTVIPASGMIQAVYGTLGTPAAANTPGGRTFSVGWTGSDGHLWLFGGFNISTTQPTQLIYLNDLWQFDPATMQWAWMGGSNTPTSNCPVIQGNPSCGSAGVYGTLGTPGAGNWPGGRYLPATWVDSSGRFWLFGGWGLDSKDQVSILNDLWVFDPATGLWAWMGGDSTVPASGYNDPGVYGTAGVPAAGNFPGSLTYTSQATDANGNTWIFGGWGYSDDSLNGLPNALWEFDQSAGEWAWWGGGQGNDPDFNPSVFGTQGVAAAGNIPGSRWDSASWADANGKLWFFGGDGYDNNGNYGLLNELWRFDPSTSEWTWVAGTQVMSCVAYGDENCGQSGTYGTLGQPAAGNLPGGHSESNYWTDKSGNFWLFGGIGFDANGFRDILNDLWEFNPKSGQWTWMGGPSNNSGGSAVYGTLGVPAPANLPGRRDGATSWVDQSGNFWLFGGNGLDANGNIGILNDVWRYQPSTGSTPVAAAPTFSPSAGTYTTPQLVTISDATPGATIYYTTDGTTPTPSSARYSAAIPVSATETIQAIATATGYSTSPVASATYTFQPNFSFTLNPASLTVQAGQSGTSTITVAETGGFNANIVFTCSGLPAGDVCSFGQEVVPTSPNTAYVQLTVTTAAATASLPSHSHPLLPAAALATILCCIGWKRRTRLQALLVLASCAVGFSLLTGCIVVYNPHSQPATYPVTVTGTSGTLTHSATLSLTVK